jgi:hypothetical protein
MHDVFPPFCAVIPPLFGCVCYIYIECDLSCLCLFVHMLTTNIYPVKSQFTLTYLQLTVKLRHWVLNICTTVRINCVNPVGLFLETDILVFLICYLLVRASLAASNPNFTVQPLQCSKIHDGVGSCICKPIFLRSMDSVSTELTYLTPSMFSVFFRNSMLIFKYVKPLNIHKCLMCSHFLLIKYRWSS